ncbi:MAG: hypothetical protein MHM6MM_002700 [Cercozoa sp. M6MM]
MILRVALALLIAPIRASRFGLYHQNDGSTVRVVFTDRSGFVSLGRRRLVDDDGARLPALASDRRLKCSSLDNAECAVLTQPPMPFRPSKPVASGIYHTRNNATTAARARAREETEISTSASIQRADMRELLKRLGVDPETTADHSQKIATVREALRGQKNAHQDALDIFLKQKVPTMRLPTELQVPPTISYVDADFSEINDVYVFRVTATSARKVLERITRGQDPVTVVPTDADYDRRLLQGSSAVYNPLDFTSDVTQVLDGMHELMWRNWLFQLQRFIKLFKLPIITRRTSLSPTPRMRGIMVDSDMFDLQANTLAAASSLARHIALYAKTVYLEFLIDWARNRNLPKATLDVLSMMELDEVPYLVDLDWASVPDSIKHLNWLRYLPVEIFGTYAGDAIRDWRNLGLSYPTDENEHEHMLVTKLRAWLTAQWKLVEYAQAGQAAEPHGVVGAAVASEKSEFALSLQRPLNELNDNVQTEWRAQAVIKETAPDQTEASSKTFNHRQQQALDELQQMLATLEDMLE